MRRRCCERILNRKGREERKRRHESIQNLRSAGTMVKANLRILESTHGSFHKAECSVCGAKFYVLPGTGNSKEDMLKQFDAHLCNQHQRQWEAEQK